MTQFVIPNADPVATLTFDSVVTVDISSFTNVGDYISLSLPEFQRTKINVAESYVDFTSNEKGDFGSGPTDSIKFSEASPALPATNGDTEMRIPVSLLKSIDKSKLSGVRFRIFATEECNFRCLSIRACDEHWKYAPIDLDTLWDRVHRPPSTNGSTATRTNLVTNPSFETNMTEWGLSSGGFVEATRTREEAPEVLAGEHNLYAARIKAKKDATTTQRFLIFETLSGTSGIPVTEGKTYTMSGYVYMNDAPQNTAFKGPKNFFLELYWYTSSGTAVVEFVPSSEYKLAKGELVRVSHTETAPAGAAFVKVRLTSWTNTENDVIDYWIDHVQLEEGAAPTAYFDGNYPGANWTGTPNASTSVAPSTSFPTGAELFPRLFRSAETFDITDPMPVNMSAAVIFSAGSFSVAKEGKLNEVGLYFRDIPVDDQTQVEINSLTQDQLNGLGKQPDYGKALYDSRDQEDLDIENQFEIDTTTQFSLERKRDESEHSWISVTLKWGATGASLYIWNADEIGYSFTSGIEIESSLSTELNKGKYMMVATIKNSTLSVQIYRVDQVGNVGVKVYDTGVLRNATLFKRRKGRFGWVASLQDGDAYIESIKTRGVNYGEIISKEFQSITPVKGVSLFAGATEDKQLVEHFEPASPYTTIELDTGASQSGNAIKVINTPGQSLQGIATNVFKIDDPNNLDISFDIKYPSSKVSGGDLVCYLLGDYEQVIQMNLTGFQRDTWSHIKVSIPRNTIFQTGDYQLVLMTTLPVAQAPWWIENLSVKTSSVKFAARSYANDPWSNPEERWQEAGNTLNEEQGGIVFAEPGTGLQIRAQTFRQDAAIHDYKAIPQYATLGRITFPSEPSPKQSSIISQTKAPGNAVTGTGATHEFAWTNPQNVKVNDTNYATVFVGDYWSAPISTTEYGFTIPSNATIVGVQASVNRNNSQAATVNNIFDRVFSLLKGSTATGNNLARGYEQWPHAAFATALYGGNTELWGNILVPTDVNASGFGFQMSVSGGHNNLAEVNWITLTVYYTLPVS